MRDFLPELEDIDSEVVYYNLFNDMPELENLDGNANADANLDSDADDMPELENSDGDADANVDANADDMPELENAYADANADADDMPELKNADAERIMRLFYIFIFFQSFLGKAFF
jgi:hypothetical protein